MSYEQTCAGCERTISAAANYCPFCGESTDREVRTDGGHSSSGMENVEWWERASDNVQKWGLQDVETLLLAMQEELGELTQSYLEAIHEDGDPERIGKELADLAALCFQLQWALNDLPLHTGGDR